MRPILSFRWRSAAVLIVTLLSTHIAAASSPVALTINATAASRYPINPYIYGMNFADSGLAAELKLPVNRWGGNSTTRYNWQLDTENHASDYYFENIPNDNTNVGALPNGSASDQFIDANRTSGSQSIITMPLIGWTPKDRNYDCGFSIAKYGAQTDRDYWRPDCGNGIKTNGQNVTGNNPTDTSVAITPAFDTAWIAHLITRYGTAAQGGVGFYQLDNEPMLWNSTHRDVHPTPTSYDEMKTLAYQYAPAIKQADPSAAIIGPSLFGWTAYFWSALDEAPGGAWWNNPLDRNAHGGVAFTDWYLQQMAAYQAAHGTRVLDYFDLHFYPQANGVSLSPAGDANTQALRLRSTRSLWDPTYVDESWIATAIAMIPRMHTWVNTDYPGTKISLSEYNWGGLESINGALTQADVLGIFGREKLDMATLWDPPSSAQPGAYAFRMYRNYDGAGSQFGDNAVVASSTDQSQLAVYGAVRSSDGALTLIVINKTGSDLSSPLALSNFTGGNTAKVYRYSSANLNAIVRQADQPVSGSGFTMTYPANAITLVVIPAASTTPKIDTIGIDRGGQFYLRLSNTTGNADITAAFNPAGQNLPIVGDWTGAGYDTIGVYNQSNSAFTLCTSNTTAACASTANHISFTLGNAGDTPLSGRWASGATNAGAGVYRPTNGILYTKNALNTGYADHGMVLGLAGDSGVAGDWTGKGYDSPGIYRSTSGSFYLLNTITDGIVNADLSFAYGAGGDVPIVGDWIAQGHDGVGMFRPSNGYVYLRNTLSTGYADNSFFYGVANDLPIAGHWQLTYPGIPPIAPVNAKTPAPAVPNTANGSVPSGNGVGG